MTAVCHDPGACRDALVRTVAAIVVDLETTGLSRHDQIVSAGLLIDGKAYILFARSLHASIRNIDPQTMLTALQPMERADLVIIGHNLPFDLGFLYRAGIHVKGELRDTLKLLRLLDQDRGAEGGQDKHKPRMNLRASHGPEPLNYKLKSVAAQLLGIRMPHFPGQIELAPYNTHARYLACDLAGTQRLHDLLWPRLTEAERTYYRTLVAPLIPVLLDMSARGVCADPTFLTTESQRLSDCLARLSTAHEARHGLPLGMTEQQLTHWLFQQLKLPALKCKRFGKRWRPSLDADVLRGMHDFTDDPAAQASLEAIQHYRQAASLLVRLRALTPHVQPHDGRIHSTFDDRQATGRVSSTHPNLQQLAKAKSIVGEFRSRNALVATPGHELAVFDIGQADIRALAHMVESFERTTEQHLDDLRCRRADLLGEALARYDRRRDELRNPDHVSTSQPPPAFTPAMSADLAADFAQIQNDFYTTAVGRILGRAPVDKAERNRFKVIILSVVNSQGPPSLAKALGCTKTEAKTFLQAFERAYPKVAAYKALMHGQIACTGQTQTFMGRVRTVTAHRWLVTEPCVQILISHKHNDPCWLDVVPLEPGLRVLTTYVRKAWNARTGRRIYEAERGSLTTRPYRILDDRGMQYRLPVRNIGWRSIRRVRVQGEEAIYEGFDATARTAFNFICQGGTADICKIMMLRSQPVCARFQAHLLIQIHDELVFEVPEQRTLPFLRAMKEELEKPPVPGFRVPIVVEPKRGRRFGELTPVSSDELKE